MNKFLIVIYYGYSLNDFTFYKDVAINLGLTYNLSVDYISGPLGGQFLEVWIDWDNSGTFETSNSKGANEKVLTDNIDLSSAGSPSASITPPASAELNTLLRMRVVSEFGAEPNLCGAGTGQRADDYGVYVKPACTDFPNAGITNNSESTVVSCETPLISLTATGGDYYFWSNNLGNNASVVITEPGTYNVIVMSENGCSDTETITIGYEKTAVVCDVTSLNSNDYFYCGVTNVSFNTINNASSTYIPANAKNDFICENTTTLELGTAYDLDVTYQSRTDGSQYLEVWIDWDSSGTFDTSNANSVNEQVLSDNIDLSSVGTPSVSISPPSTAVLNTVLRMRVVSDYTQSPVKCGSGFVQRADDYGVIVSNVLNIGDLTESNSAFRIFPNPVKDQLTISLENNGRIDGYEVYDITGKKVMLTLKTDSNIIDTSGLPSGLYFLKVKTDTLNLMSKFIKD